MGRASVGPRRGRHTYPVVGLGRHFVAISRCWAWQYYEHALVPAHAWGKATVEVYEYLELCTRCRVRPW